MPVSIGETVVMDDAGNFTSDFKPSMIGEDYADSKAFEDVPSLTALLKSHADTKSALGKKLDNVIQRPAKGADDKAVAEYHKGLRKELGSVESIEDFSFTPPDGREHDKNLTDTFKKKFLELGTNPVDANILVETWDTFQVAAEEAAQSQFDQDFETEVTNFKKTHLGDNLVKGTRTALKAAIEFGDEDFKAKVKESGLIEAPDNFDLWRKLSMTPSDVVFLENVGIKMGSDKAISDQGLAAQTDQSKEQKQISLQYDHSTSVQSRKDRGIK